MKKFLSRIFRDRRGFTLMETLIVVGIVAALAGVSVFTFTTVQRSLRQKELDTKAQLIYTSTQNRMTQLRTSGRKALYDPLQSGSRMTKLGYIPMDALEEEQGGKITEDTLYYIVSNDKDTSGSAASCILPAGQMEEDIRNAYWIIELDPDSGTVYGVFYSEETDLKKFITDNAGESALNTYRLKKVRTKNGAGIGYYGGETTEQESNQTLTISCNVENAETLSLTMAVQNPTKAKFKLKSVDFTVAMEDSEGNKHTEYCTGVLDETTQSYKATLTLDDLSDEKTRFKTLYGPKGQEKGLEPGSDISIRVTAETDNTLVSVMENKEYENNPVNSLFDAVNGSTAYITCARHLQNLDADSGVTSDITDAVQKDSISCADAEWMTENNGFEPILNENLKSYTGSYTDGKDTKYPIIADLKVKSASSGAQSVGLFEKFSGTLTDITLTGTVARALTDGSTAGALVGTVTGTTVISGCEVYLQGDDLTEDAWTSESKLQPFLDAPVVGGLVGTVQVDAVLTIKESSAATVLGDEGKAQASGGLVGANHGELVLYRSYADCYVYSKTAVGGLVGSTDSPVAISSCYAAGYLNCVGEKYGLAPSVGTVSNGTATYTTTNSYSACSYSDTSTRYGVAASGDASNCYYLAVEAFEGNTIGKAYSYDRMAADRFANTLRGGFTKAGTTEAYNLLDQGLGDYPFPKINRESPNDRALGHYGDWALPTETAGLVYYEFYDRIASPDNTAICSESMNYLREDAQVFGDGFGVLTSTNKATVTVDVTVGDEKKTCKLENYLEAQVENLEAEEGEDAMVTRYIYMLDCYELLESADEFWATAEIHVTETVNNREVNKESVYRFNPVFAHIVEKTSTTAADAEDAYQVPQTLEIRSPRQLWMLGKCYDALWEEDTVTGDSTKEAAGFQTAVISQKLDLNYAFVDPQDESESAVTEGYVWKWCTSQDTAAPAQAPVGIGGDNHSGFQTTYKGEYHSVSNLTIASNGAYSGLFGVNMGLVENLVIRNVTLGMQASTGSSYAGTIVGVNHGTVSNCAVSHVTSKVDASNGSRLYLGGIAGDNVGLLNTNSSGTASGTGVITHCSADLASFGVDSSTYATVRVGGITGANGSSTASGTVERSYAGGLIQSGEVRGGAVLLGGVAGANSAGTIRYSYSTCAFVPGANTTVCGVSPTGGGVLSCYYLTNGAYSYMGNIYTFSAKDSNTGAKGLLLEKEGTENDMQDTVLITRQGKADSTHSYDFTKYALTSGDSYPFTATVTDATGAYVHYGNWVAATNMGARGAFYWEREDIDGTSSYQIYYLGVDDSGSFTGEFTGDNLCTAHDDGGVIAEYGYGYFYKNTGTAAALNAHSGLNLGERNTSAEEALADQIMGYTFVAYTTAPATEKASSSYLYPTANQTAFQWTVGEKGKTGGATFYINPFFARSIAFGDGSSLGTSANTPFEIRSADQLQYLNWNQTNLNCSTQVTSDYSTSGTNTTFTYLNYLLTNGDGNKVAGEDTKKFVYKQTHDINRNSQSFYPIGGLYDKQDPSELESSSEGYLDLWGNSAINIVYFGGQYTGNDYVIRNVTIRSNAQCVGLFGCTMGAKLSNVVLYSDANNTIKRENTESGDTYNWYSLGALVGFAGKGKSDDASKTSVFESCVASGYNIYDNNSGNVGYGGGSVGGLVGMTNMNLSHCTASNNIYMNITNTNQKILLERGVHAGGLVGCARCTVSDCYVGGEIVNQTTEAKAPYYKIWIGGLCGGAVLKTDDSMESLVGSADEQIGTSGCGLCIKNCYVYTKVPEADGEVVEGSYSIASSGMLSFTACDWSDSLDGRRKTKSDITNRYVYIYNSYALLSTSVSSTDYLGHADMQTKCDALKLEVDEAEDACEEAYKNRWKNYSAYLAALDEYQEAQENYKQAQRDVKNGKQIDWTCEVIEVRRYKDSLIFYSWEKESYTYVINKDSDVSTGRAPYRTYEQMQSDTLVDWLNEGHTSGEEKAWSKVTTETTDHLDITGKYSYYGGDPALEGTNYPFPTIMTTEAENVENNAAYVHYGAWPLPSLIWEEANKELNIFDCWNTGTSRSQVTVSFKEYPAGKAMDTSTTGDGVHLQSDDENVVKILGWDAASATKTVTVQLVGAGTATLTAACEGYQTAAMRITVSDTMTVTLDASAAANMNKNGMCTLSGYTLKSPSGSTDLTKEAQWSVKSTNSKIAEAVIESGSIKVTATAPGDATVTLTGTITRGGKEYNASYAFPVTVADPGVIGIADFNSSPQKLYHYDLSDDGQSAQTAASYAAPLPSPARKNAEEYYALYFRGDDVFASDYTISGVTVSGGTVSGVPVTGSTTLTKYEEESTTVWADDGGTYAVTVGTSRSDDNNIDYIPFTLETEVDGPLTVTFTLTKGERTYTLSLDSVYPMRTVEFFNAQGAPMNTMLRVLQGNSFALTETITEYWNTNGLDPMVADNWETVDALGCEVKENLQFYMGYLVTFQKADGTVLGTMTVRKNGTITLTEENTVGWPENALTPDSWEGEAKPFDYKVTGDVTFTMKEEPQGE